MVHCDFSDGYPGHFTGSPFEWCIYQRSTLTGLNRSSHLRKAPSAEQRAKPAAHRHARGMLSAWCAPTRRRLAEEGARLRSRTRLIGIKCQNTSVGSPPRASTMRGSVQRPAKAVSCQNCPSEVAPVENLAEPEHHTQRPIVKVTQPPCRG